MHWMDIIVTKYPGWALFGLIIVGVSLAEALGEWGKRR